MAGLDHDAQHELLESFKADWREATCPACGARIANGEPPDMELDRSGYVQLDESLTCGECGYTARIVMSFECVHEHVEVS